MPLHLQNGDTSLNLSPMAAEAWTPWCHATIPLILGPDELSRLATALRSLSTEGHGSALWVNETGEIRIEVVMAKRGETHWSVRLQSPPDFLHELRLMFVGRQDDLESIANGL